jgi:F-type H+-transporting ATPase subunit b
VSLRVLLAFLVGGLALPAAAAGDAEHGPDWAMLALQVLNTGILGVLLVRFARQPIRDFLARRRQAIAGEIAAAEQEIARAREEVARLRTRLAGLEREADALLRDAQERAEAERENLLARANAIGVRVREEARRVADQEIERARQELRDEAAALAVSHASELLRQNVRPADDERLLRDYSARVGSAS